MRMVCWGAITRAVFGGARGFLLFGAGLVWLYGPTAPAEAQLADSAWPMAHHDLQHTGRSQYNGPLTNHLRWVVESRPFIKGSPIIGPDGKIYLGVGKTLFGYSADDGSLRWTYQLPSTMRRNTPGIAVDGKIFVGARDNRLWAIDSSTGKPVWSYTVGNDGDVSSSPAIVDALDGYTVYMAGTWNGIVHAIADDGTLLWKLGGGGNLSYTSPAVDSWDGTIYIATTGAHLRAIDPDGNLKWDILIGGAVRFGSPSIGPDRTVYVPTKWGLVAVSPGGEIQWEFLTGGRVATTPAIDASGNLYFGSAGGSRSAFYSLQADGDLNWAYEWGESFYSSAALGADGTIYTTAGGTVMALDPIDGSIIWDYATPRGRRIVSAPAIGADGTLYVTGDAIYAFGQP